jgi:hexosaminidase
MLDVARHFHNVATVKSLIDGMCRYKLNVLHFHLTDDQGWRFESKKFPLLTEIGSIRAASPMHWSPNTLDNIPYGPFFYTQSEIQDIISYAHDREITIVPEIEMPGHAVAALSAFPNLSCTGGPFTPRCFWGVDDNSYCPGNDDTLHFLEAVLDEVIELFDSEYIHVGGDEVSHVHWETCPKCQARMRAENLSNTDQLQSWFIGHFARYLAGKNKRLIGWDEILQGGLPNGTTVMSWEGTSGGIAAASMGHDVIMTPSDLLYVDKAQFRAGDQYEYINGFVSLFNVYHYDPTDEIDPKYQKFVIGTQANLWTEYVWARDDLEWKLFPRVSALSEIAWTNTANLDWNSFVTRFGNVEKNRLAILGRNSAPIASGLSATWESDEIPTRWVTMQWPVTGSVGVIGAYQVAFVYERGKNALKVNNVKLWVAGSLAGGDDHDGVAFDPPQNNIFRITTIISSLNRQVYITANVSCDGGSDSNGKVYVYSA